MKQFLVHTIVEEDNVTHGIAVTNNLIYKNFETMVGEKIGAVLPFLVEKNDNFFIIERFCQYVGYIQFRTDLGLSMKLSDFKNNMDNVLDEYLELEAKDWELADRMKYIEIVDEIIKDANGDVAEMIEVPLLH